jgi:hypothetical protein
MKEIFVKTDGLKTIEDALISVNCNFDAEMTNVFHAIERPVQTKPGVIEYDNFGIPNFACVRRSDNKQPLGITSARYGLVQHRESLGFITDLSASNEIQIYGANSTDHGATVFVAVKAPKSVVFGPGDEIECFFTASNSLDRSGSIEFMLSPVHKQTQTILTTLDTGVIRIRHTKNAKDRLARAVGTVRKMNEVWANHAEKFERFAKMPMNDENAKTYFAMVAPSEEIGDDVPTRIKNVRDKLFDIYKVGVVSRIPSCRGTLLGGFTAALVFGDYYKSTRTSCVGRTEHDILVESRLTGSAARFKADAFAYALRLFNLGK